MIRIAVSAPQIILISYNDSEMKKKFWLEHTTPQMYLLSKMWQADFSCKQFWHNSYPECEHEEYIRDANMVTARKLIWFSSNLIHVKTNGKQHCCHAEQNHCDKTRPSGKPHDAISPVWKGKQHNCDSDTGDTTSYEHKRQHPFRLNRVWYKTLGWPVVDRQACLDQANMCISTDTRNNPVGHAETSDGEHICR